MSTQTGVPEKILQIARDVAAAGCANVTRLTILKKWFARPERLTAFALWIAARAIAKKGRVSAEVAKLFAEARAFLRNVDGLDAESNGDAAGSLFARLRDSRTSTNGDTRMSFASLRTGICFWSRAGYESG